MEIENSRKVHRKVPLNLPRILAIAALLLIFGMAISIGTIVSARNTLDASVRLEGTQFRIYNNNDFQWTEARLVLNNDYKITVPVVLPHSEVVLMTSQFVKDDGTSFDIAYNVATDFYINARISGNQMGSWFYKFR